MTLVRATCERCGDVRLPASEFVVRIRPTHDDGEYRFRCSCGLITLKPCTAAVITLLTSAGVRVEVWELPLELLEHPVLDLPLSEDEVIDLYLAFEDGTAFDKIVGDINPNE